jgi:mono/diheme cytochrome c family protein
MDRQNRRRILVSVLALTSSLWAQTSKGTSAVSAVEGESWLSHLHRSFAETSMGKTGRLGPALPVESSSGVLMQANIVDKTSVPLHGADLYRFNCRGCHGESGQGAPPEINSVINPVRSGSAALVMERMKKVGMSMSRAEANKLARQSQDALLDRLHHGGQDMPAFPQLNEAEIRSLVAYLKQLADVPAAEKEQVAVQEAPVRVGEHIVKSTCHVCHSAAGPNPDSQQLADGAIPPLSVLTSRVSRAQFIRKVTRGAPIVMGTPAVACRGRMPVFYYLSEEEAADAYLYLALYPPNEGPILEPAVARAQAAPSLIDSDRTPPGANAAPVGESGSAKSHEQGRAADMQFFGFAAVAGLLVCLLLVGGFGFTVRECMRIAAHRKAHAGQGVLPQATNPPREPDEGRLIA